MPKCPAYTPVFAAAALLCLAAPACSKSAARSDFPSTTVFGAGSSAGVDSPAAESADGAVARQSPGLGTSYGESRASRVSTTTFVRGSSSPDAVLQLRYNDFTGIRELARHRGGMIQDAARATTPDGTFAISVMDEGGNPLPGVQVGNDRYAVGMSGRRYLVGIENHSGARQEVVTTVDGLDVIDGEAGSFHKRGYIVDPLSSITVDGWRTSNDTVAAFRLSSIDDSYAGRTGRARNIGVIGVAFFSEEGAVPLQELQRRESANPFPQRFVPPPPPR